MSVAPLVMTAALLICFAPTALHAQDDWKPAKGPLLSKFAKDLDPKNPLPEYPRPQMVRKQWQSLNGLWQFAAADEVKDAPVGKDLSGKILVPFCMESALSGVGKHHDRTWYRRTFAVPKEWAGQRVLLHFGAVDYESTVWVNGKEFGKHVGGYDAFSYDVTDALKSEGEQELIVGVIDTTAETQPRGKQHPKPHGIWYTPVSGIWQTVWIEPVPASYIRSIRILARPDDSDVVVGADTFEGSKLPAGTMEVLEGDRVIASRRFGAVEPNRLVIDKPRLWSPDDPFLYGLRITAGDERIESYFGMRKIEVSPDEKGIPRMKLNGKTLLQVGPLDQGWWPDGLYTAPTDAALKYDLEVTKQLGFNMIRKHVKVEPQRWYYHADTMGFLVWQDMPNVMAKEPGEWQKQFEGEMKALIEQHFNSPSIVMWVPFNEGWGQDGPYNKEGTIRITNWVKEMDPSRLVNNASGWTDSGAGDVHDVHAYPGPSAPKVEEKRAIVLGEFGGLGLPVEGHMWEQKAWGYQNMTSPEELTHRYVRLLGRLWQLMDNNGLCAGVYTQTTDVESEANGLLTYDRAVLKVDETRVREANLGQGPRIDIVPLVKTAREEPAEWQYTLEKPPDGWQKPEFDAAGWKTGKSGFGTKQTPGATVNTEWNTSDIWLRREIDLPADALTDAVLYVHHDEDALIFINGVQAARMRGFVSDYVERPLRPEKSPLKPGKNLIAVHCKQTGGGQFIDVGLVRLIEKKR